MFNNLFNFKPIRKNRSQIYRVIEPGKVKEFIESNEGYVIDVRTKQEYDTMHVKNAINVPLSNLSLITKMIPDKNAKILVYCMTGSRTNQAIQQLYRMGYGNLYIWGNGGLNTLKEQDLIEKGNKI